MPEGDTIWRVARSLDAALAGREVVAFASTIPAVAVAAERLRIPGRRVLRVESRGKNLLVRFEGGPVLRTHQGMQGEWRVRRKGGGRSSWAEARARIDTADVTAACFGSPVVELLSERHAREHPALARLGPDLLDPAFSAAVARERLRARGAAEVGAALLDQTALAGIGNVYKSETLFLCAVPPRARVRDLDDDALDRLVETARRLMRRNLSGGPRRTTSPLAPGLAWVYGRAGAPCRRCGASVTRLTQGDPPRSTYFCPRCQAGGNAPLR
jgi:endonuclease-8